MRRSARNHHRRIWMIFGLLLPAIVVGALFLKQSPLDERPAVLIEAPEGN